MVKFPKVDQANDFNYTVLFSFVLPNVIPDKFADFVYKIFEKYSFFVEFYYLTPDGMARNNLGHMRNIILNYQFFKNESSFKLAFLKKDMDFSINIVFSLEDFEFSEGMVCNLTCEEWFLKLRKLVYDKLKQY